MDYNAKSSTHWEELALDLERIIKEANKEYERKNYTKAIELYKQATTIEQDRLSIREGLIRSWIGAKRFDEAHDYCLQLLDSEPGSLVAHLAMSTIYRAQKKYDEAEAEARKALAIAPGSAKPHFSLAGVLFLKRDFKKSEQESRQAISLEPSFAHAHILLGATLSRQLKYREALESYKEALSINPKIKGVNIIIYVLRLLLISPIVLVLSFGLVWGSALLERQEGFVAGITLLMAYASIVIILTLASRIRRIEV